MARLSLERQQQIDAVIADLKDRTGLDYPESKLLDLVRATGAEVLFVDFSKIDPSSEISGAVSWKEGDAKIYINQKYSPKRKTFTLAHELGHFLLHPEKNKFRLDAFNYSENTEQALNETEANYFAGSLLMPKSKLVEALEVTKDTSIIARYFGVSEDAVRVRIQWLQRNK